MLVFFLKIQNPKKNKNFTYKNKSAVLIVLVQHVCQQKKKIREMRLRSKGNWLFQKKKKKSEYLLGQLKECIILEKKVDKV